MHVHLPLYSTLRYRPLIRCTPLTSGIMGQVWANPMFQCRWTWSHVELAYLRSIANCSRLCVRFGRILETSSWPEHIAYKVQTPYTGIVACRITGCILFVARSIDFIQRRARTCRYTRIWNGAHTLWQVGLTHSQPHLYMYILIPQVHIRWLNSLLWHYVHMFLVWRLITVCWSSHLSADMMYI